MRRITGLDLNGWRDIAVRDTEFDLDGFDDGAQEAGGLRVLDGGIGSVVVTHGSEFDDGLGHIGGPQALISPIGRGNGWGAIGRPSSRSSVLGLLDALLEGSAAQDVKAKLGAAAAAMSAATDELIVVMPDVPQFDEDRQEVLLEAIRRKKVACRLLWHPVAVLLAALGEQDRSPIAVGTRVLCINHCATGLRLQQLVVKELPDHAGILAPERAGPGSTVLADCGLQALLRAAEQSVGQANPRSEFDRQEKSQLPLRLILDPIAPSGREILRNDNGTWSSLIAPPSESLRHPFSVPHLDVGEVDLILVTTPLALRWRRAFHAAIVGAAAGKPVRMMEVDAAAKGALAAGRRIEKGIPHYLDKLEQISLLVMRDAAVAAADLVPADAVVMADREYVSAPVTGLAWPAGGRNVAFYLRKGGEFRRWQTSDVEPPSEPMPVTVQLRQMPAQGRAQVWVTSPLWERLRMRPVHLDWSRLEADPRSFEAIAEELRPRPVVPDRVTGFTHIDRWNGSPKSKAFAAFIMAFSLEAKGHLVGLASILAGTVAVEVEPTPLWPKGFRPARILDYDGRPPDLAPLEAVRALDQALEGISKCARLYAAKNIALRDNNLIKAATWAFGRCPSPLQEEILRAVAASFEARHHPFLAPTGASRVLVHGLGRVVTEPDRLARAIDLLLAHPSKGNVAAALASLLSRPAAVPSVMSEARTSRLVKFAAVLLNNLVQTEKFGVNLTYALNIVGGLLRCRSQRPYALVRAESGDAARLYSLLSDIRVILANGAKANSSQVIKKVALIENLQIILEGSGGDSRILLAIEEMENEEADLD